MRHRAGKRLRVCVSIYVLGIVLALLPFHRDEPALPWQLLAALGLLCLFAGLLAAWLYYQHVSRLAWRLGSRNISIQAKVLGVLNVLMFLGALLPELDGAADSLTGITKLPTIAFGSPHITIDMISSIRYGYVHWEEVIYLTPLAWALFIAVWLFYRLIAMKRA